MAEATVTPKRQFGTETITCSWCRKEFTRKKTGRRPDTCTVCSKNRVAQTKSQLHSQHRERIKRVIERFGGLAIAERVADWFETGSLPKDLYRKER